MTATASAGAGRRRVLIVLAALSLGLNAFFVARELAEAFRQDGPRLRPWAMASDLRRWADRLPDGAEERIVAALNAIRPEVEGRLDDIRAERREVEKLAAAPAPDRAEIDRRLAEIRATASAVQVEIERTAYDALLALPDEMRVGLAAEPPPRRPR